MGMPVRELQQRMTSAEFSEWQVFLTLEPGHLPIVQVARLAALLANIHRDPKQRASAYRVEDFFPELAPAPIVDEAPLPETAEDVAALVARQRASARRISHVFRALAQQRKGS